MSINEPDLTLPSTELPQDNKTLSDETNTNKATHLLQKKTFPMWQIAVTVISILMAIFVFLLLFASRSSGLFSGQMKQTTPSPIALPKEPSPTPQFSEIASVSAYLNLKATVAELTTTLNNYPLNDQTLTPPIIEIPLGFSN